MFVIVCLGIALSVVLLEGCMAVPDIGFPVWIVLMAILWFGIPAIGTKYYESDFSKERYKKSMLKHYHKHQLPYCINCVSASSRALWFKIDREAQTKIEVNQCKNCGSYYVTVIDCTPGSTKQPEIKIITEEEANAYCQRKDGICMSEAD